MHGFVDPRSCPSPTRHPRRKATADPEDLTELLQLCRDGRLYDIEQWIRDGRPLQADRVTARRQRRSTSALRIALKDGNQALVLLLLCNGYDPNLEPSSPLDLALSKRRWDLLDLLLDWGADSHQVDPAEVFGTYRSELFRRFRDMGVDLTADHALAEALARHTSNKPLFGFAKRQAQNDPKVQRELSIALAHHASEGNAKGVALCLWAGADPHAPVPSLRFDFGPLDDDEDEDGFRGFSAIRVACSHGDGKILERLGPDSARDDFDDLYLAASSPEAIRVLAQQAPPSNVGAVICGRLAWDPFNLGGERWRTMELLRCIFEVGGRWHAATKDSIAAVRKVLIRVPDDTLVAVTKLLTKDGHCEPEILKELARTPAIRRRIEEVGFMPSDQEEATHHFRRSPPPRPTRSREVLKKLGVETEPRTRPLPRTVSIGGRKPGRQAVPLDRQTLFERVWSDPITTVALEWGISDQGLRKACKKLRVPVPPRGYWARTRAGQRVPRPRLPALPAGTAEEVVVWVVQ